MSSIKVSELTAKTTPSGSEELLINDGGTSKKITIDNLPDTDTTYTASDFKLDDLATPDDNTDLDFSTTKHGLVPKGTDTGKFLKDNGTWATPTDTNTTYSNFVGDSGSGGTAGLAPAPTAGDAAAGKYLDSSGGWTVPPDTDTVYTLPTATASVLGGIKVGTNLSIASGVLSSTDTNTTYTSSDFSHDSLSGVTANEHIDWTTDQGATNIHSGNYTDTDTTYTAGDGLDLTTTEFSLDLKADGGLAIDATELKLDLTQDQSWTGSQRGTPSVVTDGTLDLNTANNFKYTPAASPDTLEFTNETAGQSGFITVINASGHTIATGSEVKKGASWDVSTAGTYIVSYYCDGTNVYVSASEALA